MLNRIRRTIREKGQGLTEYVLILAFIAGIAFMMFGGNGSLRGTLVNTFTETHRILAGLFSEEKTYSDYFHDWRNTPLNELSQIDNDERIKADQDALAFIARAFIGLPPDQAQAKLKEFTNGNSSKNDSAKLNGNAQNGYSKGILVPFSYYDYGTFDDSGYIKLDNDQNPNTATYLASDARAFPQSNSPVSNTAITQDRLFYSNDMLGNSNSSQRTVSARLHYTNGVVDSVDITARKGAYNGAIANGLNLTVTETSYSVNTKDYVTNPNQSR